MTQQRRSIPLGGLRSALERLDRLLRRAVGEADEAHQKFGVHPYEGLCVTEEEVASLSMRQPLPSSLWPQLEGGVRENGEPAPPVVPLQRLLGLSGFELDAILIALAPELDLKYERLFAYLNDDLTKKRPTVDLVLKVLCSSSAERLEMCRYFEEEGSLLEWGALHFVASGGSDEMRLSRQLRLDPVITGFLIGQQKLDQRLRGFCTEVTPSWSVTDLPVPQKARGLLSRALSRARNGEPIRIYLQGPNGCGRHLCAEGIAMGLDAQLVVADLSAMSPDERDAAVRLVLLHARLFGHVPCLKCDGPVTGGRLSERLSSYPGTILLHGWRDPGPDSAFRVSVDLDLPSFEQRRRYWLRRLDPCPPTVEPVDLDVLSARFELSFPQIRAAVFDASCIAQAMGRAPTTSDLMDAARRHSSRDLASMSDLMEPSRRWCDLVLPDESSAQLRELCDRVRRRHRVLERWGFGRERRGIGVNALFVGMSGTGKTLAAEVIAAELGLNLYRIDLATVVSKYIGETEKNLDRIFGAAERSNAVLLFDEADALFGKRSIVRDAHDRYANVEIAYLLQRLESYPGVSILTTNLSENLDQAFTRRLAFRVYFPLPGPVERQRIWDTVWPPEAPLDCDFQSRWLAERFKLTGGNIRNIALAAACLVADDGGSITMTHVLRALRREYQKMGKVVTERELQMPGEALRAVAS